MINVFHVPPITFGNSDLPEILDECSLLFPQKDSQDRVGLMVGSDPHLQLFASMRSGRPMISD
jgi:hypothetical protein